MFVTVEIKKPLEVCFHPWQNLVLNCTHNNAYRVISTKDNYAYSSGISGYSCRTTKLIQMEYQATLYMHFFLHSTTWISMINPYQVNVACVVRFLRREWGWTGKIQKKKHSIFYNASIVCLWMTDPLTIHLKTMSFPQKSSQPPLLAIKF